MPDFDIAWVITKVEICFLVLTTVIFLPFSLFGQGFLKHVKLYLDYAFYVPRLRDHRIVPQFLSFFLDLVWLFEISFLINCNLSFKISQNQICLKVSVGLSKQDIFSVWPRGCLNFSLMSKNLARVYGRGNIVVVKTQCFICKLLNANVPLSNGNWSHGPNAHFWINRRW